MDEKERALRRWFEAWLTNNGSCIGELFAPDAVYSECWGRYTVRRSRVGSPTGMSGDGCSCGALTGYCAWAAAPRPSGILNVSTTDMPPFNSVTLADFDADGRIVSLREFQSDPVFPYGDA